jgi:hypothetical protein
LVGGDERYPVLETVFLYWKRWYPSSVNGERQHKGKLTVTIE